MVYVMERKMNYFKTKYFECDCGSYMHNLRVVWFQDEWMKENNCEKELYVDIHLNHYLPWYKRVWTALRYIFKKEVVGAYDCVVLDYKTAKELRDFLDSMIEVSDMGCMDDWAEGEHELYQEWIADGRNPADFKFTQVQQPTDDDIAWAKDELKKYMENKPNEY